LELTFAFEDIITVALGTQTLLRTPKSSDSARDTDDEVGLVPRQKTRSSCVFFAFRPNMSLRIPTEFLTVKTFESFTFTLGLNFGEAQPCPCGTGMRLGRCHNRKLNTLRDKLGRRWFSSLLHGSR